VIGYLRGQIKERSEEAITLDVQGVGYELHCSTNTLDDLFELENAAGDVQLWVQTHVREDAITLFGFSTSLEKRMFLSLLKVNGVGPKMALKILSGARLEQLSNMIEAGDVKSLSNLPKVGKKTAEQLILALKGKLVLAPESEPKKGSGKRAASQQPALPRFTGARADVLSALVNLGFRLQDAERVVADLPEDIEIQQGVRQGLQALSGSF
jgi:Holliday junction DNA helicase RuvA